MKLKDCRILFNWSSKKDSLKLIIEDIEIHEISFENGTYHTNRRHHERFTSDWGNANSYWKDVDIATVLIEYFVRGKVDFINEEVRNKFINELMKIDEVQEKIKWLDGSNENDDE